MKRKISGVDDLGLGIFKSLLKGCVILALIIVAIGVGIFFLIKQF